MLTYIRKEEKPYIESKEKAIAAATIAFNKKAKDVLVLELKALSVIAEYFVICSGASTTQVRAIVEAIKENFSKNRIRPIGIEGLNYSHWVLMDYGDVIMHVFEDETREYYQLEKLWLDAPRINVEEKG